MLNEPNDLQVSDIERRAVAQKNIAMLRRTIYEAGINIKVAKLISDDEMQKANQDTIRRALMAIDVWEAEIRAVDAPAPMPSPNGPVAVEA